MKLMVKSHKERRRFARRMVKAAWDHHTMTPLERRLHKAGLI